MKLIYRLVGYDRATGRIVEKHSVPAKEVHYAKKVAGLDPSNPELIGDTPLTDSQAKDIAGVIHAQIDTVRHEYFLEPYSEMSLPRQREHA